MNTVFLATLAFLAQDGSLPHEPLFDLQGGPEEVFGVRVLAAGDVNDDGNGDVLVYSVTDTTQLGGLVGVYSGSTGDLLHFFTRVSGNTIGGGTPAAGAGDVDNDGHDDLILGVAPLSEVRVYSGADGSELHFFRGEDPMEHFGGAVAGAGDVNNDGHDDVIIGATFLGSYAQIYSGKDGALLHTLAPEGRQDRFGASVAGAGDVNGDGCDDVIVGAHLDGNRFLNPGLPPFVPPFFSDDDAGSATVFSGATGLPLFTVYGDGEGDGLGHTVSGAGDVNGDGFDDVIAGTFPEDFPSTPPYARVYSGLDGVELFTLLGDATDEQFRVEIDAAGDVNMDGFGDVMVGSLDAGSVGRARIYSGSDQSILFEFISDGSLVTQRVSVAGLGDIDGDGVPDFATATLEAFFGGGFARIFASSGGTEASSLDPRVRKLR